MLLLFEPLPFLLDLVGSIPLQLLLLLLGEGLPRLIFDYEFLGSHFAKAYVVLSHLFGDLTTLLNNLGVLDD